MSSSPLISGTCDGDGLILLSQSTAAILMENMDLYMLNPCSNKIW